MSLRLFLIIKKKKTLDCGNGCELVSGRSRLSSDKRELKRQLFFLRQTLNLVLLPSALHTKHDSQAILSPSLHLPTLRHHVLVLLVPQKYTEFVIQDFGLKTLYSLLLLSFRIAHKHEPLESQSPHPSPALSATLYL